MEIKQLISQQPQNEIREEIKTFLKTKENGQTIYQNLLDTEKAILRGVVIVIHACIRGRGGRVEWREGGRLKATHHCTSGYWDKKNKSNPQQVEEKK